MAVFKYLAFDKGGKKVKGSIDAQNKLQAGLTLKKQGLFVQNLDEAKKGGLNINFNEMFVKVTARDKGIFAQQLSTMIGAGMALTKCLDVLATQTQNLKFKRIITAVAKDISHGNALSWALARHPDVFDDLFISMVKVGESGGEMDKILIQWAQFMERDEEIRGRLKAALMYPFILTIISTVAIVFLIVFVLPTFTNIFASSGVELPAPTRILLFISDMFKKRLIYLIAVGIGVFFFYKRFSKTKKGKYTIDMFKLKAPIFGTLQHKMIMTRFSRTFGVMLGAGVPIIESLNISRDIVGNVCIAEVLESVIDSVREGGDMGTPFAKSPLIPPMIANMIPVGEVTGTIEKILIKIADFYEREVDYLIRNLSSILEPVMILFMGVIVGFIALSLVLPMYDMIKVARAGA
jgi:type IV pilus assembly protein PilC